MKHLSQLLHGQKWPVLCSLSLVHTCSSCFLCFCRIPALCITYLEVLANLQQLYFCLLCSARCGGFKCACVQISGNVGVSTFLLDSYLILPTHLGFIFAHTPLSLSVLATCSIHHVQGSFFLLYVHYG